MSLVYSAVLAGLPIVLLLVLLIGLRWSTATASAAALAAAAIIAVGGFDYGADVGAPAAVLGPLTEAGFSALLIAWILLPALAIFHLQRATGRMEVMQHALARISSEPAIVVLLVAWFFALFLEGAAGFGTPVALAAPFLVSAGIPPARAVTLVLVGHAAGVSFGALGTPIQAQAAATGLDPLALARATALHVALVGWMLPAVLVCQVRAGAGEAARRSRGPWAWAIGAGALFVVPYLVLAQRVGPELPTLVSGLAGGAVFAACWRLRARGPAREAAEPIDIRAILIASAPYLLVVALVLATRLLEPLRGALSTRWTWSWFGGFEGTVQPLLHPGTMLAASFVLGAAVQRASLRAVLGAVARAACQLARVLIALALVLALARVLVHAGMIDALADAAARGMGPAWALLAPFIGALGTFVTGSATSSNILFSDFQAATAVHADLPTSRVLGAQTYGAAMGNMIAPMNVVAGAATVGIVGQEGEILRRTLGICLACTAVGGLLAAVLSFVS